jgi:hypothetical protein
MSSWLKPYADINPGARNASSARRRPRRATCGLSAKDGSKMTSGTGNVFLEGQFERRSTMMRGRKDGRLHLLRAEELLGELVYEFDQDVVRPSVRVPEYGHPDVAVAEAEDSLGPVPREAAQLEEEGELDVVPAVGILLLGHGQVRLYNHHEVLDIYGPFLALLSREAVLF